jgi:hypothetical protein
MAYREADERDVGSRNFIPFLFASKRPLRKEMIQMTGQSH